MIDIRASEFSTTSHLPYQQLDTSNEKRSVTVRSVTVCQRDRLAASR
jgi:hypothetical protein